jgi:hypothetical protein
MRSIAFDEAKQDRYKAALARAAGTPVSNVDIKSIKEGRAGSVRVETEVSKWRFCLIAPFLRQPGKSLRSLEYPIL